MGAPVGHESIDEHLARLARQSGVPFDVLADRWADGKRGLELTGTVLAANSEWITTHQAVEILGISSQSLCSERSGRDLRRAIEHRSRSALPGRSSRAVGALWRRAHVAQVAEMRRCAQISLTAAARVVLAVREGRWPVDDVTNAIGSRQ